MCPDRDLLSAYADGEVPSPWKERIAEHLASCGNCAAVVERYESLRARFRADACSGEVAMVERVRARVERDLASRPASPRGSFVPGRVAWPGTTRGRRVSLPLPLAAAAAAALLFFAGLAAAGLFRPSGSAVPALASAEVIPNGAQEVSMDGILRYLDSQNAQVTLTINLPSETTFGEPGNPVIVRASKANKGAAPVSTTPSTVAPMIQEAAPPAPAGSEKDGSP